MTYIEQEKTLLEMETKLNDYLLHASDNEEIINKIYELRQSIIEYRTVVAKNLTAWDRVCIARSKSRPTTLEYIESLFDDFIELHGDRYFGDDASIVGGIATLNGKAVTIIGQQKGRSVEENIKRNFGMPSPEGYRKAHRLMKQAEKFNRPIICFVDTPGAYPGIGAEERGQGEAIAQNLMLMSSLKVPIITIIIGEGGSGGALALAVADRVWMLENSIYSILSPEGFATILYKDSSLASKISEDMKLTAHDLLEMNIIDRIIDEPLFGIQINSDHVFKEMKQLLMDELELLKQLPSKKLVKERYDKFRRMGVYE